MIIQNNPKNASAIIVHFKKKILLVLRSKKNNIFYPNHYGLFGGSKEKGESFLETARRELEEETNIFCTKDKLNFFIDINFSFPRTKIIKRKVYTYKIDNIVHFRKLFILGEGKSSKFFSYNEIKKKNNIVPYDKLAIDLFYSKVRKYNVKNKN